MPSQADPTRSNLQHETNHAEDKKTAPSADLSAPLVCGDSADLPQATLPIIGSIRPHRHGMWSAVLAISILFFFSADNIIPCSAHVLDSAANSLHFVQHFARASGQALLEVFQVYPPVLTLTPEGVLEITDGSSNASVEVITSRKPTCQETIVVHSFRSYNAPYAVPYSPPSCAFNRVTWNLTVTAAGRQYDRLGTVSFGDIELFRTSTAEPTQNGIEWTYLKVCGQPEKKTQLTPSPGHDKLLAPFQN